MGLFGSHVHVCTNHRCWENGNLQLAGVGLYAFFVAKVQWQTTELGNYPEAEGQWGAVPGQLHHLQVWRRIWGAADPPKSNAEPCRIEGGQGKGGPALCPGEGAGTPLCIPSCHRGACCSHLAGLLLGVPSRSPAADRNQRLLQPPAHLGTLWPPGWS